MRGSIDKDSLMHLKKVPHLNVCRLTINDVEKITYGNFSKAKKHGDHMR